MSTSDTAPTLAPQLPTDPSRGRRMRVALPLLLLVLLGAGALALQAELLSGHRAAPAATAPGGADAVRDPVARLGAELAPIADEHAAALGLQPGTALTVREVQPESCAARAGLLPRDVITGLPAGAAASWDALGAALEARVGGGELQLFVRRDGHTHVLTVALLPADLSQPGWV